ncbi:MAG: PepSY domain-containing protein [Pseudomonadota bacterium]
MAVRTAQANALYRTIWRWHFYAGLFVIPFVIILSVTGGIFLFKPQLDRWQERAFQNQPQAGAVAPSQQVDAALAAFADGHFDSYRLPAQPGDAPVVHLGLDDGTMRDVYVSPQGRVLGSIDPETLISATVSRIHGQLLGGKVGAWVVETAGSWAIVMVMSGLYLWWPRGRGIAGVLWPRFSRRAFWRDLHAVTGFWVAGLAMVLLVTALPWAGVWGDAFKTARAQMGWVKGKSDWKIGAEHAEHDHAAMLRRMAEPDAPGLDLIVARARAEHLASPVLVRPPGAPDRMGTSMAWTVKSDAQNRPLRVVISYDADTGREIGRSGQGDKHPIDQAVAYGIAWHEGALFGWVNQLVGLLTALMLICMAVSGTILWWRRRPEGRFGAPHVPAVPARIGGVVAIIVVLAAMLPMLAFTLGGVLLAEWLVLRRIAAVRDWLGLRPANG